MSNLNLDDYFDHIYVINLPYRVDRKREMEVQLSRVGLSLSHKNVTLFSAIRPINKGGFSSIGACGVFMSHVGVLEDSIKNRFPKILVLEDDANFTKSFLNLTIKQQIDLLNGEWDMLYLGYRIDGFEDKTESNYFVIDPNQGVLLTHAIGITTETATKLLEYLKKMLVRPPGDPLGGPMLIDGAFSWFRKDNPSIITIASSKQMVIQRSSKTDIHNTGLKEYIPMIGFLRKIKNAIKKHS